eukprot:11226583-Lingulodinium_polyedra.AAC.1
MRRRTRASPPEIFRCCARCAKRYHPKNPACVENGKITAWSKRHAGRSRGYDNECENKGSARHL